MYVTNPNSRSNLVSVHAKPREAKRHIAREIKAGTYLFRQGDEATHLYKVVSGVFRLSRLMESGRRQVIAFGYSGDIIGFPNKAEYTTDCDALSRAMVVSYRRDALERGEGDPVLHQQLLQAALFEISEMQDHLMMLGQKSASEKIASLLCVLADRVGAPLGHFTQFSLPMSRSDIADFLGLTTETVSRSLTQLRRAEIIAVDKIHTVIVLKSEALLAIAAGED